MGLVLGLISGCSNKDLESLNEEKERLTNEIVELKISEKDEEIVLLIEGNINLTTKRSELTNSLKMVRWSSNARNYNDTF